MAMLNRGPTPAGEGMRPRVPLLGRGIGGGPPLPGRAPPPPPAVTGLRAGRVKLGGFSAPQWALGCLPPVTQSLTTAGPPQLSARCRAGVGGAAHAQGPIARWRKGYSQRAEMQRIGGR